MTKLLTAILIFILVIAHGSSVAAAVCGHASGADHVAARQSDDATVSVLAFGEEAADKMASRKGTPAETGSVSSPTDMLPSVTLEPPFRVNEPLQRERADPEDLTGQALRPLLEPPTAS